MKLEGLKILYLLAPEFEDLEFWVPLMRLQEEGADVTVAAPQAKTSYTGKYGVKAVSDIAFGDMQSAEFDAVIIPGGWAPDKLRRYQPVKQVVRELYDAGKTVGMICHAGLVGISAGIVQGHTATGSLGIKDDLVSAGATWVDQPAFRSGNLVWGRVVPDIPYFCKELVAALSEYRQATSK
ncbi:MAG: type 1 glutamine amidotransferase [Chloroflexi bacterium]|jgi:protease I|nr:type 1 glutamine amidotransferase domain-containing protein [Anaerolineaceae bacterium]NMB88784.1 type 1 glutamine amidotransferase [Chloroflexota bacterium]